MSVLDRESTPPWEAGVDPVEFTARQLIADHCVLSAAQSKPKKICNASKEIVWERGSISSGV
jgi:hypothetical protein